MVLTNLRLEPELGKPVGAGRRRGEEGARDQSGDKDWAPGEGRGGHTSVFCLNRGIERGNGDTKEEIVLSFPTSE